VVRASALENDMILAQVEASRSYVGCLDPGSQVVASLKALCKEKGIECAVISGYGYLEDPVLQKYLRSERGYSAPVKEEGMFVSPFVHGSLSLGEDGTSELLLFMDGTISERGRSRTVAGRLLEAVVRQFEFHMMTVDNVILHRMKDKPSGLALWLQMLPSGLGVKLPTPSEATQEIEFQPLDEDVLEEDVMLVSGDWLNHPRLGMCQVISYDGEDRIKVKLQSGRIAELLMSMFILTLEGVREGGRVFRVEVRKKG